MKFTNALRRKSALLSSISCSALLFSAAPALAQAVPNSHPIATGDAVPQATAPNAATDDGSATRIADIVVTAQRRSERLQDTPISVTALSAQSLEQRGVINLTDVSKFAPNLELHQTNRPAGGGSAYAAYIRGVGTGDFQFPSDPGVGLYVDDVYIARSVGGLMSLEDITRIEVLKGPQGTLYGRNTIGGAINIVTAEPKITGDATGFVTARAGSYGRADISASINAPLIDDALGAKLSVAYLSADGPGYRPLLDRHSGGEGRLIVRGGLKYAHDGLTLKINADYTRQRQQPPSGYFIAFAPAGATIAKLARYNQYAAPYLNAGLGLPAGTIFDGRWISPSPFRILSQQPQRDNSDIGGVAATLAWNINDAITLRSITAYRRLDADIAVDGDQSPYPIQQSTTTIHQNQFSEELQFSGSVLQDRFKYLVGFYAFRENGRSDLTTLSYDGLYQGLIAAGVTPTAADGGDSLTHFGLKATSFAIFSQESFAILPNLELTAGARMNWDKKDYDYSLYLTQRNVFQVPVSDATASWNSFTPKLGIDFHPSKDVLLYASYSKGFKSGGFGASNNALAPTPRYDPEKLTTYEVGLKSSWFDHRLILNAAAFYSEYREIQLTVNYVDALTNANLRTTRNAGGANLKGFEAEITAIPFSGLTLNGGLGYVRARFNSLAANAIASGFAIGDRVPQIPEWSMNAGAQYDVETGLGHLTLRGDVTHKGNQYLAAVDPTSLENGYTILGARIAFSPTALKGWVFSVDAVNLTDKVYNIAKSTAAATGQLIGVPSMPRTIFGTVKFRY